MLSLVVKVTSDTSEISIAIANIIGWIGIRADDLATALLVSFAPLFIALAAREE